MAANTGIFSAVAPSPSPPIASAMAARRWPVRSP